MAVSVLITNTTASPLALDDLYVTLGAAGSSTAGITITRSVSELDAMNALKTLLNAGSVTVVPTQSADNVDFLSIPLEQHGVEAAMSVNGVTEVVAAVVFPKPFPTGVVPNMRLQVDKTLGPTSKSNAYVANVTNLGFDIQLDVTTLDASATVDVHWQATY